MYLITENSPPHTAFIIDIVVDVLRVSRYYVSLFISPAHHTKAKRKQDNSLYADFRLGLIVIWPCQNNGDIFDRVQGERLLIADQRPVLKIGLACFVVVVSRSIETGNLGPRQMRPTETNKMKCLETVSKSISTL